MNDEDEELPDFLEAAADTVDDDDEAYEARDYVSFDLTEADAADEDDEDPERYK